MALYQTACPMEYKILRDNARHMRKYPTEAEEVLWNFLRRKQLGFRFYRQHIIGDYIVDFVCIEKALVIEVDGKYHTDGEQKQEDEIRENWLKHIGYRVLRFTNEEVLCNIDNTITIIKQHL